MKVTAQMRREMLQRKVLAQRNSKVYESKLIRLRDGSIESALKAIEGVSVSKIVSTFEDAFEEPDLPKFYSKLYMDVGKRVGDYSLTNFTERLGTKSDALDWQVALSRYVSEYTGQRIVLITGSLRDEVIGWLQDAIVHASEMGIEQVTRYIYEDITAQWDNVKAWQVRRIVQTEMMASAGVGQDVAVRSLGIEFTKTWTATFNNTREQHALMDGVTVGMDDAFTLPNGDLMMFPSDFSMGASAENLINCSCGVYNVPKK